MYVLGSGPVTLIDTAPKLPGSLPALEKQLAEAGFTWKDVERIIITHGHIDHFGLVGEIRRAAGHDIPCHVHEEDAWRLSGEHLGSGMWSGEEDRYVSFVGMPDKTAERLKRRSFFFRNLCDPVDDAHTFRDGDTFRTDDFELTVIHTPGHSPGCCCLYEGRRQILFSGDHLLKHITPNPFHETRRSRLRDPGYRSLKSFQMSLSRIEGVGARYAFPGHGDHIEDIPSLIAGYRKHHRERSALVREALMKGPRPIFDMVPDVFGKIDEGEVFLAVSEILVHLELLIEDGRAGLMAEGPPALFRVLPA
jgi:glyoxylase-like metal-dependent hydrolase (beta-lactamase superfamily II)